MNKQCTCECDRHHGRRKRNYNSSGNAAYSLGMLGALIFISRPPAALGRCTGVLKAIVWPAFVVYELMKMLQM